MSPGARARFAALLVVGSVTLPGAAPAFGADRAALPAVWQASAGRDAAAVPIERGGRAALAAAAGGFDLSWWTLDAGGGRATGAGFVLDGTLGQPDAGRASGGDHVLTGGFWAVAAGAAPVLPDDVFRDGFEPVDGVGGNAVAPRKP